MSERFDPSRGPFIGWINRFKGYGIMKDGYLDPSEPVTGAAPHRFYWDGKEWSRYPSACKRYGKADGFAELDRITNA